MANNAFWIFGSNKAHLRKLSGSRDKWYCSQEEVSGWILDTYALYIGTLPRVGQIVPNSCMVVTVSNTKPLNLIVTSASNLIQIASSFTA